MSISSTSFVVVPILLALTLDCTEGIDDGIFLNTENAFFNPNVNLIFLISC